MYRLIKVRSKCQLKGCRSTGLKVPTYSASASKEGGRSVIACEKCIEGMFETLCQMRGVPTYAELLTMQKAEGFVPNDDEKEAMLANLKLLTEENEKLKAENKDLSNLLKTPAADEEATVLVTEEDAKEVENTVSEEDADEEAVDKTPEVKRATRKKSAGKSE